MEDAVLTLLTIAIFIFGYTVAERLDRFMETAYTHNHSQPSTEKKNQIMLTKEKSLAEIELQFERFRKRHGQNAAIIFVSEESELYEWLVSLEDPDEISYL
ncbi:MAG: hypothetical protein K6C08_09065 [Oscillospiraceae bacterium]|nr:hypothetical protein [Oscillospiraceae bacterium]